MSKDPKVLIKEIRETVISKYGALFLDLDNITRRTEQEEKIRKETRVALGEARPDIEDKVVAHLIGFGKIDPLFKDMSINDIMINGLEVWIDKKGDLYKTDIRFDDIREVEGLLQRIVQMDQRKVDWNNPLVDFKLPDQSRVNAVIRPSAEFPYITIRRFGVHSYSMEELIQQEYLTEEMAMFLDYAVKGRLNILVCGPAGASKTSLLRTLGSLVPADERIITIEDVRELNIEHPHVISLEATNKASSRDLVKNCLRMRPDRMWVGECRAEETFELLQAMGTGHDGSATSVHSNNNKMDAFQRLMRAMVGCGISDQELLKQITSVIDITLFIRKFKDGSRRITHISEVLNGEKVQFNNLFIYDYDEKKHRLVNSLSLERVDKIKQTLEVHDLPRSGVFNTTKGVVTEW